MHPQDLRALDPVDSDGVSAYDASEYKRWMKKSGAYECNVCLSAFDPGRFTHMSIPPALGGPTLNDVHCNVICLGIGRESSHCRAPGDVRTLAVSKFWVADGEKQGWKPEGTIEPICVRAHAGNLPDLQNLVPLNRDPDRLAFVYAWVKAKEAFQGGDTSYEKTLKSFATRARCIRALRLVLRVVATAHKTFH